jgi:hypothetical protein
MATTNTNNYNLPKSGYVAFDAMALRQLIIDRLNEQNVFTDQNFIGSNLASIIDIVAYSYHTLIYYLNKTSTESMFSEAQLYENINRIVKLIDYSPIGYQTSTLSFQCSAGAFNQGLYTIPRYSYVLINDIAYSFNEDITFNKFSNQNIESLTEISQQKLLYQGRYQEYPLYTAAGDNNEIVILNTTNINIDHFNIDVYVKPALTNVWEQYTKTTSLFLENSTAKKYEIRLNGNKRYEIKFGNDINGKKLQTGDNVAIYYLKSDGSNAVVGPRVLSTASAFLTLYSTPRYSTIINDVLRNEYRLINTQETINLVFDNEYSSTPIKEIETVDEIRQTAPSFYKTQYRLVTTQDYETFVSTNFANFITEVKAFNNWEYVSTYLKYLYDIGLVDPQKTDRALLNQITYADSCNFNNIYLIIVPRSGTQNFDYLVPAQKELINSSILNNKMATTETVFLDPVYKSVTFGLPEILESISPLSIELDTEYGLEIIKKTSSRRNNQSIINDVANVFLNYFSRDNIKLGQNLDIRLLTQQILSIDGVETFYTIDFLNAGSKVEGLSLLVQNSLYPTLDKTVTSNNFSLREFEFLYFENLENIAQKILLTTPSTIFEPVEY